MLVADLIYNQRGELKKLVRGPNETTVPDTVYTHYDQTNSFRLNKIQNGAANDNLPDFIYYAYDGMGRVKTLQTVTGTTTETQAFGYDTIGRLTTASLTGAGAANYNYTYSYDGAGNILSRMGTDPDLLTYGYGNRPASGSIPAMTGGPHAVTYVDVGATTDDWRYDYDAQGNLDGKYIDDALVYNYTFDVENRLTKVVKEAGANDLSAEFTYDADGNRLLTIYKTGATETSRVYTPFAEYEKTVAGSTTTERSSYFLAGQLIAVRVRVGGTGNGTLTYAYNGHLGNVVAWLELNTNGIWVVVSDSLARYDPFGNYRTKPAAAVNPDISDRGFTGHRQNNTGANDLGLIYMNARYYMPEIGRFISADTIVPEAEEPQSFNRYAYALNSPVNFTDPSGHCINNYEPGSADMDTCLAGWSAVTNYLAGAAYGPGGSGHFPNELVNDWLLDADIGILENLMEVMGIDYGFTWSPPQGYTASGWRGGKSLRSPEFRAGMCDYWQSCYEPVVTKEEMQPDAVIGGVSGSAAGIHYGVIGVERLINLRSQQRSNFSYNGQGAGVALEADASGYIGAVWNLDSNLDYEGISPTLTVDIGAGHHVQASLFWEVGSVPFTGETWGISLGYGGGGGFGVSGSYGHYTCFSGCR